MHYRYIGHFIALHHGTYTAWLADLNRLRSWRGNADMVCYCVHSSRLNKQTSHFMTLITDVAASRVARYPVFQGSSRIWAPISRLPERSYPGDEISRISIRTCQSPVIIHGDTLYGPCTVAIAYTTTMQIMRNSTVCYIIQHTVLLWTLRRVVPHSEHWTLLWTSSFNPNLFWGCEIFPFTGRGTDGPKPEAGRAENGGGVLGRGQRAHSPPAKGLGERCKFPQFEIWCKVRPQNLLQKCSIMSKLQQKG